MTVTSLRLPAAPRLAVLGTVILVLGAGCSSGSVEPQGDETSERDFAQRAKGTELQGNRPKRPREQPASSSDDAGNDPAEEAKFVAMGSLTDPGGDGGPGYADIAGVLIESNGNETRVSIEMAGPIVDHVGGENEVVGVAVDMFTKKGDYQLFASGENDGWFGYLYTPKGIKPFTGAFTIDSNRFVFTVPWSAFGGPLRGKFRGYSEWSDGEGYSEDLAPDDSSRLPFG